MSDQQTQQPTLVPCQLTSHKIQKGLCRTLAVDWCRFREQRATVDLDGWPRASPSQSMTGAALEQMLRSSRGPFFSEPDATPGHWSITSTSCVLSRIASVIRKDATRKTILNNPMATRSKVWQNSIKQLDLGSDVPLIMDWFEQRHWTKHSYPPQQRSRSW